MSLLITGMLTLFVAFIGYRMLFGQLPTIREGVLACVKIGIVLALATSWPAYQRVIYDVVLHEPANLVAEIAAPASLPGSNGGLVDHLDAVDGAFASLSVAGVGVLGNETDSRQIAPPLFAGFDTFALGSARVLFLVGAIGAFALLRIAAGLLLALGPLFIAFLLFEGTRGLFEGWLRGLIAAALGALATAIVLAIELALLEPWLSQLLAQRAATLPIGGAPAQLLATTVIFGGVLAAMLLVMGRIAFSWKLPISWPDLWAGNGSANLGNPRAVTSNNAAIPIAARSRAAVIAEAIAASERREGIGGRSMIDGGPRRLPANAARSRDDDRRVGAAAPLGHTFPRRVGARVSAGATTRDRQ
ncbi:MAG TPA: type IV secretion system protein [Sphingomonas sp.]|nr:type IV secretion system protein [Sphingomonas sp.]